MIIQSILYRFYYRNVNETTGDIGGAKNVLKTLYYNTCTAFIRFLYTGFALFGQYACSGMNGTGSDPN